MEKLDVWERNRGGTERKGPVYFRVWATPWSRGEGWRACLRHLDNVVHTQAIKARLHGAEDAAWRSRWRRRRRVRSKRFVGEVIELDRARPPSSTMFKPLLDEFCGDARHRVPDQKRSLHELFDSIALLTHRWTVCLKTGC